MNFSNISSRRKFWARLATDWIPVKSYRKALRGILWMGVGNYIRVLRGDRVAKFDTELSVVAIMKNEGPYLKEWLDFHILAGVGKFYLYDNGSTDNTTDVLAPYISRGVVEYKYWPGVGQQNVVYIDALRKYSNKTRWMAFIDLDEFIVPVQHKTIPEFLHTLPRGFGGLVMSWVMYGSAGHVTRPDGLVMENFKYHADASRDSGCKSIVNPRLVVRLSNPHIHAVAGFLVDENGRKLGYIDQTHNPPSHNKIRCNHYLTKSYEEYIARGTRLDADGVMGGTNGHRSPEKFKQNDTNDVFDPIMDSWIPRVKSFKL